MPLQKPAGLDEAVKPFVAMRHAWSLSDTTPGPGQPGERISGIADASPLRAALPLMGPTVGDMRTLLRVLESVYGEFTL